MNQRVGKNWLAGAPRHCCNLLFNVFTTLASYKLINRKKIGAFWTLRIIERETLNKICLALLNLILQSRIDTNSDNARQERIR